MILLLFVIPQFESLFKGFGADLPAFTQDGHRHVAFDAGPGWLVLLIVVGAGFAFFYFKKRSRPMRQLLDRMMLEASR